MNKTSVPVNISAAENDPGMKTVRVGYYHLRNCMEITNDGTRRYGYTSDYLSEITAYSKWNIEYVDGEYGELMCNLFCGFQRERRHFRGHQQCCVSSQSVFPVFYR